MVGASLVFYATFDWRWVSLLVVAVFANHVFATRIAASPPRVARRLLTVGIALNIGLYAVFGLLGFFIHSAASALSAIGLSTSLPVLGLIMPVGLAFVTLQAVGYLLDVHARRVRRAALLDYATYATFFPTLVAGPLIRSDDFFAQLKRPRSPRNLRIDVAMVFVVTGLVKKVVLADMIGTRVVDPVFSSPNAHSAPDVLLGMTGFVGQLFCDLSGYTDLVIAIVILLGLRVPVNFDRPLRAVSMVDFWSRWLMTVTGWFTDRIFTPLSARSVPLAFTATAVAMTAWYGARSPVVLAGVILATATAVQCATSRHGEQVRIQRRADQRQAYREEVLAAERAQRARGVQLDLRPFDDLVAVDQQRNELRERATATLTHDQALEDGVEVIRESGRMAQWWNRIAAKTGPFVTPVWDQIAAVRRPLPVAWLLTFIALCLGWAAFRSPTAPAFVELLGRLFTGWTAPSLVVAPATIVLVTCAIGINWLPGSWASSATARLGSMSVAGRAAVLVVLIIVVAAIVGPQAVQAPISFGFS